MRGRLMQTVDLYTILKRCWKFNSTALIHRKPCSIDILFLSLRRGLEFPDFLGDVKLDLKISRDLYSSCKSDLGLVHSMGSELKLFFVRYTYIQGGFIYKWAYTQGLGEIFTLYSY